MPAHWSAPVTVSGTICSSKLLSPATLELPQSACQSALTCRHPVLRACEPSATNLALLGTHLQAAQAVLAL